MKELFGKDPNPISSNTPGVFNNGLLNILSTTELKFKV
jgi:hypothetical protein